MANGTDQHRKLIAAAMSVYIPAMRQYITRRLDDALGPDWYETWLKASLERQLPAPVRQQYRERLAATERGSRDPHDALDPDEFPYVIRDHSEYFPNEIGALRREMLSISKSDPLPQDLDMAGAQRQAGGLLANCDSVLRTIDEDAARRLPRLPDTGVPDSVNAPRHARPQTRRRARAKPSRNSGPDGAQAGAARRATSADSDNLSPADRSSHQPEMEFPETEDIDVGPLAAHVSPRLVMTELFTLYERNMRDYIGNALYDHFGDAWLTVGVLDHAYPKSKDRMREDLAKGNPEKAAFGIGDFEWIIKNNKAALPLRGHRTRAMELCAKIYEVRNDFVGHDKLNRDPYPEETAELARDCASMLDLCGRSAQVEAIRQLLKGHGVPQYTGAWIVPAREPEPPNEKVEALGQPRPEAQSRAEGVEREDDPAPSPARFEADPERRPQRPDELPRLEAVAAAEQLGAEQRALADVGEDGRSSAATQRGPSGGGGGPGAVTLEGTGDEDRPLAVNGEGDQNASLLRRWGWLLIPLFAVAAFVAFRALSGTGTSPAIESIDCSPASPALGDTVSCTAALSGGEPDSLSWSGGHEPSTGEGERFTTTVRSSGDLTITLAVENASGSDDGSLTLSVPPLAPKIESIECSPLSPTLGDAVRCTAELSGGEPELRSWSGGHEPPTGEGERFTTTVRSSSDLTITLAVENASGDDDGSLTLSVLPLPPKIESIECSPPSPTLGDTMRCTAELSGGPPDSRAWSGGHEPPTGDGESFATTVRSPGDLTITLTVANAADEDDDTLTLSVLPLPPKIESIDCSPASPVLGGAVSCTAELRGGEPELRSWTANGDPLTETSPRFVTTTARAPGDLTITLTVENDGGGDSETVEMQVLPPPPPRVEPPVIESIDCSPASPVLGGAVSCTAELSGGEPASWSWSGGHDPPTGSDERFTTTVRSSDDLTIGLTVENAGGRDSASHTLEVQVCLENEEGNIECGEGPGTDDGAPPEEICAEDADGNPNCGAAGTEADSMVDEDDLEDGEWDEEPITEGDPGLMGDGEWDEEPIMEGDPGLVGDDGAMEDDGEDTPSVDASDSEGGAMSDDSVILVPVDDPTSAVVIAEAADDSIDELGVMDDGGLSAE